MHRVIDRARELVTNLAPLRASTLIVMAAFYIPYVILCFAVLIPMVLIGYLFADDGPLHRR